LPEGALLVLARTAFAAGRARVVTPCGRFLLLFAGFLEQRFAREANLVALDGEHFHQDLIAKFQLVANVADAMLGDFADM